MCCVRFHGCVLGSVYFYEPLCVRFYEPVSGEVLLDGRDLRSLDPRWLRGRVIGYINQEPVLFATSIRENIRYGKQDATDEEVGPERTKALIHVLHPQRLL